MNYKSKLLIISLLASSTTLWAHSGATGVVKERMDNFKESKASMKLLKKAVRKNDFDTVAQEALAVNRWATKLTDHFPENSNQHPSEALDRIWQEFEKFEARAESQTAASERLHQAGLNRDAKGAATALSDLAQSCKGCHDDYRE